MGISKGEEFSQRDFYVNYAFEDVMYRWDHIKEKIYVKFYNKNESSEPVPHDNRLFNDALLYGEEITKEEYEAGLINTNNFKIKIEEYRNTDGMRDWELLYEGIYFVLLKEDAPEPYNSQLLAFDGFGSLLWSLSPQTKQDYDHIVNIWFKNGEMFAGSFSGFEHRINFKTGEILETKFTK